jgi:hypothetical protein
MAWIAPLLAAGCSEFNLQHIGEAEPGATAGPEASVPPEPVEGPLLELEPAQHHFDGGCADEVEITVRNVGTEDAVLDDLVYQSGGELTLLDDALRSQLPW